MDRPAIESKVREIVQQQSGVPRKEIKPDSTLVADLGCDSIDMVEIAIFVEEVFTLSIPDEDIAKWKTVADVVAYVESHSQPSAKAG